MNEFVNFKKLADARNMLSETSSLNSKKDILLEYKRNSDKDFNNKVFNLIVDNNIKFYVTSEKILESPYIAMKHYINVTEDDIFKIYGQLSRREITGNTALHSCAVVYNSILDIDHDVARLFLDILDKNLKCGVNNSIIMSVFNDRGDNIKRKFGVALANKYFERADKVDFEKQRWFASRKCDGVRCLCIKENGNVKFLSRQEKEFFTLDVLKRLFEKCEDDNFVWDGELCQVDANGDEDFQSIVKLVRRKDFTIEDPFYQVFDMLTLDEFFGNAESPDFSERIKRMLDFFDSNADIVSGNVKILKQTFVTDISCFNGLLDEARNKGWEGLMIRRDVPYEGKRNSDLLKVKDFIDDEFTVIDYETGQMRMVEDGRQVTRDVLTNVIIDYKGNRVGVGSGFSKEQRIYYHEHPEEIVGCTITVKYFEETTNKKGTASMRFPVVKCVYGKDGRIM